MKRGRYRRERRDTKAVHKSVRIIRSIMGIIMINAALCLCWTAAYYLLSYVYGKTEWEPHGLVHVLFNSVLGFLFFGLIMLSFSFIMRKRHIHMFQTMIDALRRIAKGDFSVNLDVQAGPGGRDQPWGALVDSINNVAVELNQMEQMRQEFISNVSHEIQSPLTSVRGFARLLRNDSIDREERLRYLGIIETETSRLSKLTDNLLKLASLESKHHPFETKRYRLDKQLRSIVLSCEPVWVEKGIEMDIELDEVLVVADEDLLSQVWVNLINNCIKFTPEGGTVGITLQQKDSEAVICVSDNGIGLTEEDLEHMFERFYKADKSRNRSSGGSGLGLAIVKKIVDMHRGAIIAANRPGGGTMITVRLPIEATGR